LILTLSVIREVRKDRVKGCSGKEDHSGSPVYPEGDLDPSETTAELEQDQDHIDQSKNQDDRNTADLHLFFSR
jgi:hypothetical protein